MAPSTTPPRPHVDYNDQALSVGDHVAFIAAPTGSKPRLFTGRIIAIHDEQVCVESGDLNIRTGKFMRALRGKPDRIYHDGLYRLPEDQQGGDE